MTADIRQSLFCRSMTELVIDTPLDEAEAVKKLLVENMESAAALKVPLVAEAKSGYDWYSVK